jgi:hypothetical protein
MFSDFLENKWVLSLVTFTNRENLMELLPTMVIEPAEKMCEDRQIRLTQILCTARLLRSFSTWNIINKLNLMQ